MKNYIISFLAGGAVTSCILLATGFTKTSYSISSDKLPSSPVSQPGRYYLGTSVRHLNVEEENGRLSYKIESWSENGTYKGSSSIGSADDWQPDANWWIHSEEGVWFWVFDGKSDLRLLKSEYNGVGLHNPNRLELPTILNDKLPQNIIDKYWNSNDEKSKDTSSPER